jgi:RNA polymerase sigma-70 factor (ECF subfamily)
MAETTAIDGGTPGGPAPEDPDVDLVRRARAGDEGAYEELVRNHQRRTFNVAYRMLGDYDEALDLTQEVFIQAHRALGQYRGEARFGSWLLTIAVNQCRNRLKHWKRRAHWRHESLSDPIGEEGSELRRELPDAAPSSLEQLEGRQLEEMVREAMKDVDGEYREVLVLRELQDVAYEEIARILAVPVGTVKSRLHRGREQLRDLLRARLAPDRGAAGGGAP